MNFKKTLLALAAVSSFGASAVPITIDAGSNDQHVVVDINGPAPGGVVFDGIVPVEQKTDPAGFEFIDPSPIADATSRYFDVNGDSDITGNPTDGFDIFVDQGIIPEISLAGMYGDGTHNDYYDQTWTLTGDYGFFGVAVDTPDGVAGNIMGGFINLYYTDLTDASGNVVPAASADKTQVLSIAVNEVGASVGNISVDGVADYSFLAGLSSSEQDFVKNFFGFVDPYFVDGGEYSTVYDAYAAGLVTQPQITAINIEGDTNLDPKQTVEEAVIQGNDDGDNSGTSSVLAYAPWVPAAFFANVGIANLGAEFTYYDRGPETLDLSLSVADVSEPGSLALFGLGLLGLAGAARRKTK